MKKLISVALTSTLLMASLIAQAGGSAPPATCYPLAIGEGGQGSTNSLHLPHFVTASKWSGTIWLTNTSDKYVNVTLNFKNYDGSTYLPQDYSFVGEFDSNNSPFALATGGAILQSGRSARIVINDASRTDSMIGTVDWQADACIDDALVVSFRSQYSDAGRLGTSQMILNDGQPF